MTDNAITQPDLRSDLRKEADEWMASGGFAEAWFNYDYNFLMKKMRRPAPVKDVIEMIFKTESRPLTYTEMEMLLLDSSRHSDQKVIAEVKATIGDCRYEGLVTAYVAFSIDKLHIAYTRFPSYQVETDSIKEILEYLIEEYCTSVSNNRYFDQGFPVPSQLNGSNRIFKGVNGYETGVLFRYTRKK